MDYNMGPIFDFAILLQENIYKVIYQTTFKM